MKNEIQSNSSMNLPDFRQLQNYTESINTVTTSQLPEILVITSYPPRECGIATYSQDLIKALNNKFKDSFKIQICALESENEKHTYTEKIKYKLNTDHPDKFTTLAKTINTNNNISLVLIQHEFGFFANKETSFLNFLKVITKPIITVFHTALPGPNELLRDNVKQISEASDSIVVMTKSSAEILHKDYGVLKNKISIIPHGTHLVKYTEKSVLKNKYKFQNRQILSTFGLLSSGKSIETTLYALPEIIKTNPDVLFLIIGKTHPSIIKQEGEKYRKKLRVIITELKLENHVQFINEFLPLSTLLELLQLSDIYLFTSKDPNQAVSGTFSYAISCGCPIISTPIPHALEVLQDDAGLKIDFEDSSKLTEAVRLLLNNKELKEKISTNGIHRMASTAWENTAIAHAILFEQITNNGIKLMYRTPPINLDYVKKLTTDFGMIQFSKINQPDIESGYTLDDNARALVAMCQHYELTEDENDLNYIYIYYNFIKFCLQPNGGFLNYVNYQQYFTDQNYASNLEDAKGRAIWALGYINSLSHLLPNNLATDAELSLKNALVNADKIYSTRAMAFILKGLYYNTKNKKSQDDVVLIKLLANRLVQMYRHESDENWQWFESYLTYANSVLPEALLCAWLSTGESVYKEIAKSSFDFLLSKTFIENRIKVISNINWLHKGNESVPVTIGGEQPIDVAYTIFALSRFYKVFQHAEYKQKLDLSFNWFLGNNHLHQIIYNPCTGGCFDGLEENSVNLNQGAESTLSYLMARLTIEKLQSASFNVQLSSMSQRSVPLLSEEMRATNLVN